MYAAGASERIFADSFCRPMRRPGGRQIREAAGDELFTARPEHGAAGAPDELRAEAARFSASGASRSGQREQALPNQVREQRRLPGRGPPAALGVDEQRHRLRQVSRQREAFGGEPLRHLDRRAAPGREQPRRDQALEPAAGEEVEHPGGIGQRSLGKVRLQGGGLGVDDVVASSAS